MKQNIKLLDCTLRDGGYVNDWNFGHDTILSIYERIVSSKIDFIEVGFLDQRRAFDTNRTIAPDTASYNTILKNLDAKSSIVVAMIDYGTCDLENIQPKEESVIDGIRVIFKKDLAKEALEFCKAIKEKGYLVFTQAVSITSYSDSDLLDLIKMVNEVEPYAVSIVDTYGLLHKTKLFHYYKLMDENLKSTIGLGYHSHNNFQLGYSNSIEMATEHQKNNRSRTLILDGTAFGMGKGAGNAPLELLAMYMNEKFDANYEVSHILEAIDHSVMEIYKQNPWGYSLKYFIAASNDCHPNYVFHLLDKKTLSVKSINEILQNLKGDAKLLFDQAYIEQLYVDYQASRFNDEESYRILAEKISMAKKILVLGSGASISTQKDEIERYISSNNPTVIAINFVPSCFKVDFVFFTNVKRYEQQASAICNRDSSFLTIATSNLTKTSGSFDINFDYESLIDRNAVFMDNSFVMMLKILTKMNVKNVVLAGFDGYDTEKTTNYFCSKMEYDFLKHKGEEINLYVNNFFSTIKNKIDVEFITETLYEYR